MASHPGGEGEIASSQAKLRMVGDLNATAPTVEFRVTAGATRIGGELEIVRLSVVTTHDVGWVTRKWPVCDEFGIGFQFRSSLFWCRDERSDGLEIQRRTSEVDHGGMFLKDVCAENRVDRFASFPCQSFIDVGKVQGDELVDLGP